MNRKKFKFSKVYGYQNAKFTIVDVMVATMAKMIKPDISIEIGNEVPTEKDILRIMEASRAYPTRKNGVMYSYFGSMWDDYGYLVCRNNEKVLEFVDKFFVQPIDMYINGGENEHPKISRDIGIIIEGCNLNWDEVKDTSTLTALTEAIDIATPILNTALRRAESLNHAITIVDNAIKKIKDNIMIINEMNVPWHNIVYERIAENIKVKNLMFVISKTLNEKWKIESTMMEDVWFEPKIRFPIKNSEDSKEVLTKLNSISNLEYIDDDGRFAICKDLNDAIKLAKVMIIA